MSTLRHGSCQWLVLCAAVCSGIWGCGGGDGQPPLDELPLRDTLLGDPATIAHLPAGTRSRLRTRFVNERLSTDVSTEASTAAGMPMLNQVVAIDASRFKAGKDALLTGTWQVGETSVTAVPFSQPVGTAPQGTLPPLAGDLSGDTLVGEERALTGTAGATVEALLTASGAQRLERVIAWPIAALATGDTVYVNAAWLVAMDEKATGCSGSSSSGGSPSPTGSSGANQAGLYSYLFVGGDTGAPPGEATQSGELPDDPAGGGAPNHANASGFDSCSSSSCNNSCNNTSNSCNNTASSCNSASNSCSNSASSCNNSAANCDPTGDKSCCRASSCSVAAASARPQSPLVAYGALLWALAPLAFLLISDRRLAARFRRRRAEGEA